MIALLVVDMQNDFCSSGALSVPEGEGIIPAINAAMERFPLVVATQDWHPASHLSFAASQKKEVYSQGEVGGISQILWPVHCLQNSFGAALHPALNQANIRLILRKGTQRGLDSYSAFFENDKTTSTGLAAYLRGMGVEELTVCGLALDYCVLYSVRDAVRLGFKTTLLHEATRGVDVPTGGIQKALEEMRSLDVLFSPS